MFASMKSRTPISTRGYIKPTRRCPEARQRSAIEVLRPDEIYCDTPKSEQTIDAAVKSLRHRGDILAVPHLSVISGHAPTLHRIISRVHAVGAVVIDGAGRRSDVADDLLAMIGEATRRQGHTPDDARKYGAKGAARKRYSPSKIAKALKIWHDPTVTNREFEVRTGIPYATMRRYAQSRGTGAGRKPAKKD